MAVKTEVKLSTLSYIIVYVMDTAKSLPFYRDVLGMTVKMEDEGWIELETGNTTLALHGMKPEQKHAGTVEGQPIIVFSVDDVYATREELLSRGVKFKTEVEKVCELEDHVGMSSDFYDLDGNRFSIYSLIKK